MEQETEALLNSCSASAVFFPRTKPQILCLLVKPYVHEPKPLLLYRLLWTGLGVDKETCFSSTLLRELAATCWCTYCVCMEVHVWHEEGQRITEGMEEYLLKT